MTALERYLQELGCALHTRGRARRRLLAECSEHLADAASVHGHEEAVRRFGTAAELAESFDTEIVIRKAAGATVATIVGVLAVGASTVALLNAADPRASAVAAWAVIFFASAQTAGVCAVLAAVRAAAMRQRMATPADVSLLCRRNVGALSFSALALLAAGGAVPGHASAWVVLTGPVVAAFAALWVVRVRSLARKVDDQPCRMVRAPLADLLAIAHQSDSTGTAAAHSPWIGLLVPTAAVATGAAFLWDHLDQGSVESSLAAAGIEAVLTVAGFVLLGPALGLLPSHSRNHGGTAA